MKNISSKNGPSASATLTKKARAISKNMAIRAVLRAMREPDLEGDLDTLAKKSS